MADIFISHVEEDYSLVREIAPRVEKHGFTTWYYERDGVFSISYLVQGGEAIDEARAFLLIISPHSLASHQVTTEVVRAHEHNKRFFPLLVDISHGEFQKRQPEWRAAVGATASINMSDRGVDFACDALVRGL